MAQKKLTDKDKRLTETQFKAVKASGLCWRISEAVYDRSSLVLIEGRSKAEVARDFGITKQVVGKACNKIYSAHLALQSPGCPRSFVVGKLCVPQKLMTQFRAQEKQALVEYKKNKKIKSS